jgi:hypothetical protein
MRKWLVWIGNACLLVAFDQMGLPVSTQLCLFVGISAIALGVTER